MSLVTRLQKYGRAATFEAGKIDADPEGKTLASRARKGQDVLVNICMDLTREIEAIRADTTRTEEGHQIEIAKAAKAAIKKIDALSENTLRVVSEQLAEIQEQFEQAQQDDQDVACTLRSTLLEIEARAALRQMPQEKLARLFQSAIQNGDQGTYDAFANAPPFLPLLSQELIEHGEQLWRQRQNPKKAAELEEIREVHRKLSASFDETRKGVSDLGELEDKSLRARLAKIAASKASASAAASVG